MSTPPAASPTIRRRPDGYVISTDPAALDVERIHAWLSTDAYWALGRSREVVERSIAHSLNFAMFAPGGDQVAHFLVPAARMWYDVVHTCRHQRLFCSTACVDAWLRATGNARGSVFDLSTLWRLAAHWYDGRLDRGYVRREPVEAAEYLRGVGLSGAFWGL